MQFTLEHRAQTGECFQVHVAGCPRIETVDEIFGHARFFLQKGALPFPHPFKQPPVELAQWLEDQAASLPGDPIQPSLF